MEGLPRNKSWPQSTLVLPKAKTNWRFAANQPWSLLVEASPPTVNGSGSLSDYNNGPLLRAYEAVRAGKVLGSEALKPLLGDVGGGFTLNQQKSLYNLKQVNYTTSSASFPQFQMTGSLYPSASSWLVNFPSPITPLDAAAMNSYGTKAISRSAPNNPLADAATFLGELREIPQIPGMALRKAGLKGVGGEYLNVEFGINPILRDVESFREANAKAEAYLMKLQASSGKINRRKLTLVDETTTTGERLSSSLDSSFPFGSNPYARFPLDRTLTTHTRVWFSGAFTHYYSLTPDETAFLQRVREAKDVYGIDFSLDVAWNLLPYSWLSDWFFNIGDIAANLTRFSQDGLVMKYGYIMCHTVKTYEYTYGPSSWILQTEVKQRKKASPFGFGVDPTNLTTRQWSILAALGQQKFWR
jgi:hypothetical protein